MRMERGKLNRRIQFETLTRPPGRGKAGQETWAPGPKVWAEVQDMLPSRGERLSEGMLMASRPVRIRMDYRSGITSDMRIVFGDRVLSIVAGPAELGFRETIELVAQDYSTQGTGA